MRFNMCYLFEGPRRPTRSFALFVGIRFHSLTPRTRPSTKMNDWASVHPHEVLIFSHHVHDKCAGVRSRKRFNRDLQHSLSEVI